MGAFQPCQVGLIRIRAKSSFIHLIKKQKTPRYAQGFYLFYRFKESVYEDNDLIVVHFNGSAVDL